MPNARFGFIRGNPKYRIFMASRHHCSEATATPVIEGVAVAFLADDDLGRWLCANVELMVVGLAKTGTAQMSDGRQTITWDPTTRLILTLGDWSYDIADIDPTLERSRYRRRRANGEREEFSMDWKTGMRIRDLKGCRETAALFTSGKFRARVGKEYGSAC